MSTPTVFIYGGYIDGVFYASSNDIKLEGLLFGNTLLSGSHIVINNIVESQSKQLFGDLIGEYKNNNLDTKNKIYAHVHGYIESETPMDLSALFASIGNEYEEIPDGAYTKYITPNGNYCIANSDELLMLEVELMFTRIAIIPYINNNIVNKGVYSFVKNTLDNISWQMQGKSISNVISELYTVPDYVRKGMNPTLSEQDNKQRIKARMLEDYDKYHYYLFKIPIVNKSRDAIMRLYYNYSHSYYIDILQYDGDILGLYVIGKR